MHSIEVYVFTHFLAERTNGHAYGTMLCPSVICLQCMYCGGAVHLPKKYLKKQIGCLTSTVLYQFRPPATSHSPKWGYWLHPRILALKIAAKQLQIVTWLLLTAYRNLPTPYPTVPSPTPYEHLFSQNKGPNPQNLHAHYGQTIAVKWLLLTGYMHLPMPYLMPPLPTLPFLTKQG